MLLLRNIRNSQLEVVACSADITQNTVNVSVLIKKYVYS